jgi:DNA polymerase V
MSEEYSAGVKEKFQEGRLDMNRYLIENALATFYVRVSGDSMTDVGILPGAILVVDRSLTARSGDVVIVRIGDEICVKRLRRFKGRTELHTENKKYPPVKVVKDMDFEVWGKVTFVIQSADALTPKRGRKRPDAPP